MMRSGTMRQGIDSDPAHPLAVWLGWALLIAFVGVCCVLGDISENVRLFQFAYLVGCAGFGLLVHAVCRRRPPGRWGYWLGGCIALRLALLNTAPSDDLYRYVWEGRIQTAGFNPFAVAPDDASLVGLRDADWARINHKEYPAIYPPLAQWQFQVVSRLHAGMFGMKLMYVLFDCVAVILLGAWLRAVGLSPHRAIVYGLCPLVLSAVGVEGHLDGGLVVLLAAAGLADARRRTYWCAVFLGGAILTKIIPVVLLPWLGRKHARAMLLAVVVVVAGYLPFATPGAALFHSLVKFPRETEMLSLGHGAARWVFGADASRLVCAALIAGVALWHARRRAPLSRVLLPVFGAVIVFMPIVHFWYLTWIVPALAFVPRASWLVLTGGMVFYFESTLVEAQTGTWEMPAWVCYAVYAPFVAAAAVELGLWWRRSGRAGGRDAGSGDRALR